MQLWRIHIKPDSDEGIVPVDFCIKEEIAAVGWGISRKPSSKEDYRELVEHEYKKFDESWKTWRKSWAAATNAILDRIQLYDLIWTRDRRGNYFLGEIQSDWRYDGSPPYAAADVYNYRKCKWFNVGLMDNVPGSVVNGFNRSAAIQTVTAPSSLLYSQYLFAKLSKKEYKAPTSKSGVDLLQLLHPDDLEDVVALYLQVELGFFLYPTTCKRSTKLIECLFVSTEFDERIGIQVKGGDEPVDRDSFAEFDGIAYLFSASGKYPGKPRDEIHCLQPKVVRQFCLDNERIMPRRVRRWIEFYEAANPDSYG